jgi:hypothetical protein
MPVREDSHFKFEGATGWREVSGGSEAWFANGPSALMLGPFPSRDICLLAVKIDADRCRRDIPPWTIKRLKNIYSENDWTAWRVSLPVDPPQYVVIDANDEVDDYYMKEAEARRATYLGGSTGMTP